MPILELSQPISPDTPVYPGDPAIEIIQQQTFKKDKWNMKRLHINTHDATHVNAPIHATDDGEILDTIDLSSFFGPCYKDTMHEGKWVILTGELTQEVFEAIVRIGPSFVWFDHSLDGDELPWEKFLCEQGIIFYEGLVQVDKLPDWEFQFFGFPLNIVDGDGSPVRAIATWE